METHDCISKKGSHTLNFANRTKVNLEDFCKICDFGIVQNVSKKSILLIPWPYSWTECYSASIFITLYLKKHFLRIQSTIMKGRCNNTVLQNTQLCN